MVKDTQQKLFNKNNPFFNGNFLKIWPYIRSPKRGNYVLVIFLNFEPLSGLFLGT